MLENIKAVAYATLATALVMGLFVVLPMYAIASKGFTL